MDILEANLWSGTVVLIFQIQLLHLPELDASVLLIIGFL